MYAKTKIDAENEILKDHSDDFYPTILRFATVFGHSRRMRFDLVVNLFAAQAYHNGVITVTGANQWRPFIHVTDVAQAVVDTLDAPIQKISRQIFNIGDDRLNISIGDLAQQVAEVIKLSKRKVKVMVKTKNNVTDRRNYSVSFHKVTQNLDFHSSIGLTDGIREIYHHMKNHDYTKPYTNSIYSNLEMTKVLQKEFYSENYHKSHLTYAE